MTEEAKTAPAKLNPIRPGSLRELQELCTNTVEVVLSVAGREVAVPVRCLRPDESAELQGMLDDVRPPLKKQSDPDREPVLDHQDAAYTRRLIEAQRKVRAVALYWTCPLIREGVDPDHILEGVQKLLTEKALSTLFSVVTSDCTLRPDEEVVLGARVNFTSPAN